MFEEGTDFKAAIDRYVSTWTKKYIFYTKPLGKTESEQRFMTEFSLPTKEKPIPVCTIRTYFYARKEELTNRYNLFFQFENDELVHNMNSTVRLSWMEAWLEKYLNEKMMTRQILFLATEFENTRIEEPRLKTLEKKIIIPEKIIKKNQIEQGLVEFDEIMAGWEDPRSESDNLKLMVESVFCLFRSFDKEDLGKISKEEFFDLLKTISVTFSKEEEEKLYLHFDLNQDGLLTLREVNSIIVDILMGHVCFHTAKKDRSLRAKHHYNNALLILYNDDLYSHLRNIWNECDGIDINHYGFVPVTTFENILITTLDNKMSREDIDLIRKLSIDRFQKKDSNDFMYGDKDENGMSLLIENIISYRAEIITQGLIENDRNKLESYLMSYFAEADKEKTGYLTESQLLDALHKCPRMTLIDLEYLIISQLAPKDAEGRFDYKQHSFDIMIYLKMLFEPKNLKRKEKYYTETMTPTELVDKYSQDSIREALLKMLTAENGWMLSPEAFVDLFKSFRSIRWSEQEMQDCFSIVDSKEDGYIGRPCSSDEEELIEFGMPLYYYWLRNETMEVLKNKFIVV